MSFVKYKACITLNTNYPLVHLKGTNGYEQNVS